MSGVSLFFKLELSPELLIHCRKNKKNKYLLNKHGIRSIKVGEARLARML